jgi:hypothetical protein
VSRLFGPIRQNGYVVRDIQTAMAHWIEVLRVGPWFYFDRVKTDYFRHRGADSDVDMSIALANAGDLQIELIQQRNDAPSMYKEFLDAGREGLQHVAFWSTEYQSLYDRFAYFDTGAQPGTVIEISDISGSKGRFFEHVRECARSWDGSEPIRAR